MWEKFNGITCGIGAAEEEKMDWGKQYLKALCQEFSKTV